MKLGIMQPYFFPYIGYFQLINAVDTFVLLDDVQYIRHGWINRNRILKPNVGWQYIYAPLNKSSMTELIKNVKVDINKKWKELIIRQLDHYKRSPFFQETIEIVKEILFGNSEQSISKINFFIIKRLCRYLDIKTEIMLSSEHNFNYANVGDAGEWALRIAEQMNVSEYINPVAGAELFDQAKFLSSNIKLSFLKSDSILYSQRGNFEACLSIIDVLMFNGKEVTQQLLDRHIVETI